MAVDTVQQRNRRLARSTIVVIVAFGVAKAISLLQVVIIADVFGISAEWDAFVTANRIPEQIFNLIAGGVLAHAFIPIFSGHLARDDQQGAWRIASQVINTAFVATLLVSIIAFITAPWLVENVVAPGFDEATIAQTVQLMRVLLVTTLIFSVSGIVMGVLQSHNHFLSPALAPIMFDIGILFGAAFLIGPFGVYGIAYGAVLGALLHLGVQIPGLIMYRARWMPVLGLNDPEFWRVIRLMLPRIADLGLFSVLTIMTGNIASRLGTGAVSAVDWGWRLMQIPETLIGTAMATVIFPTLAALSEKGDETGKRDAMSGALRFILVTTIPSAVGMILVGQPLVSLLESGEFDATATALVYNTLRFFSLGIIVHSILEVVARSFYADKDTLTPLYIAFGGAAVNILFALFFTGVLFSEQPDVNNVGWLALANTLGVTFEVTLLLWLLRKRWHGVNESQLARATLKTLAASLIMGLAIVLIDLAWNALGLGERGRAFTLIQVGVEILVGALVFAGAAYALKMEEIQQLFALVLRRAKPIEVPA